MQGLGFERRQVLHRCGSDLRAQRKRLPSLRDVVVVGLMLVFGFVIIAAVIERSQPSRASPPIHSESPAGAQRPIEAHRPAVAPPASLKPSASNPAVTDSKESKALLYMSCLGIPASTGDKAWNVTHGDMKKILIMTHMAVTGELVDETPLTGREKTCRKSSGIQ